MHNGLVFEVYGIFVHKKTAPSGLDGEGCPTFGVQFKVSDGLDVLIISRAPRYTSVRSTSPLASLSGVKRADCG